MTKHHIQWAAIAAIAVFSLGKTYAGDNVWASAPTWNQSNDTDGLSIRKASVTALPSYTSGLKWKGVEWQEQRYQQNGNTLNGRRELHSARH